MLRLLKSKGLLSMMLITILVSTTGCGALLGSSDYRSILLETGEDYIVSGEYDKAITSFDSVLLDHPKDIKALTGLGVAYYGQENYDKALEKFTQAKELDPDNEKARLYLGLTYLKKGEDQKALTEWKEYTELISTGKFTDLIRRGIAILSQKDVTSEEREFVLSSIEYATQQERQTLVVQGGGGSSTLRSSDFSDLRMFRPTGFYNYYGPVFQSPSPGTTIIIGTPSVRTNMRGGIETRIRSLRGR